MFSLEWWLVEGGLLGLLCGLLGLLLVSDSPRVSLRLLGLGLGLVSALLLGLLAAGDGAEEFGVADNVFCVLGAVFALVGFDYLCAGDGDFHALLQGLGEVFCFCFPECG